MKTWILYQYDECPYCFRVERAISALGLEGRIERRNVRTHPEFRRELLALTSRTQVPCLVREGTFLFESEDIIKFLRSAAKE